MMLDKTKRACILNLTGLEWYYDPCRFEVCIDGKGYDCDWLDVFIEKTFAPLNAIFSYAGPYLPSTAHERDKLPEPEDPYIGTARKLVEQLQERI